MKNIKQQTNDECLLCAISNIYQQDIRKAVREEFPDKKGFNANYLRKIVESFSTNDETVVNYYDTSLINNPIKLNDSELFAINSNITENDGADYLFIKGFIGTKINGIYHMISFAIQMSSKKIIVFDSAKINYVIYDNAEDLIKHYDIYRLDFVAYKNSYHETVYPVFCEYFDV